MKRLVLFSLMLVSFSFCNAQEILTVRYVGYQLRPTKNNNFICKELLFFFNDNDTLKMNLRLPLKLTITPKNDTTKAEFVDMGLYYNHHLQQDSIYSITLKKICLDAIPDMCNSYYFTNAVFDKIDCVKFTEVKKDTPYEYKCNYGKFVDINGVLYEVIGVKQNNN